MKGTKIGSYIIEEKIGEGGMGVVYRARHDRMKRQAVVKMLRKQVADNPQIVKRFENEATAAASIGHPGIVQVFDIGHHTDGSLYIAMELLQGESLQDRLDRIGRLPVSLAISVIRQAAGALEAAHKAGIVHRDLKPDNMFIVPDAEVVGGERVKLLDFGIAKLSDDGAPGMQTKTGAMMGTPHYMSPEQCRGAGNADHRSDLYSLGCILFQLVTGRTPFVGSGFGDFIVAHMTEAPPTLRSLAPHAPQALEDVVSTLLAKDPAARFGSATALANALSHIEGPETPVFGDHQIDSTQKMSGDKITAAVSQLAASQLAASQLAAAQRSGVSSVPLTTMGTSAGQTGHPGSGQAAYGVSEVSGPPAARRRTAKWLVPALLGVLILAGVSYAFMYGSSKKTTEAQTAAAAGAAEDAGEVREVEALVEGPADAGLATADAKTEPATAMSGMGTPPPSSVRMTPAQRRRMQRATEKAAAAQAAADKAAADEALDKGRAAIRAERKLAKELAAKERADKAEARELKRLADKAEARELKRLAEAADAKRVAELEAAANQNAVNQGPDISFEALPPKADPIADKALVDSKRDAVKRIAQKCSDDIGVHQRSVTFIVRVARDGSVKRSQLSPRLGGLGRCIQKATRLFKFRPRREKNEFRIDIWLD